MTNTVWIDWGDGETIRQYDFATLTELEGFLIGVDEASLQWGIDDWRQFDSQEEANVALGDQQQ